MPRRRKKKGKQTVRKDKLSKQNIILYLCGIIPVVWLGLLIAPCMENGLVSLIQEFGTVMENPFQIKLCEDSVKTVLVLLLVYGIAIGVYLSTEHNYRRREEHGSAKWGSSSSVNKKYADKRKTENKLLTQNVAIGLDGRKHRRNLNVLVCGGMEYYVRLVFFKYILKTQFVAYRSNYNLRFIIRIFSVKLHL